MPDPSLRLKYYQETGQTEQAKLYEQYLRETGQMPVEGDGEPGVGTKVLGTLASLGRDIPGVEAAQAGIRSLIRRQPYREALADIRGAEDAAPTVATLPARLAGFGLASAALPGSAAMKGAQVGALTGALSSDPNTGMTSRAIQSGVGAGLGYLGGKYTSKLAGKLAQKFAPDAEQVLVRPAVRLGEASAPKAEGFIGNSVANLSDAAEAAAARPRSLVAPRVRRSVDEEIARLIAPAEKPNVAEGFVGNSMDNLVEAIKAREGGVAPTSRAADPVNQHLFDLLSREAEAADAAAPRLSDVIRAPQRYRTESGRLQQSAPKARFEWFAEQMAKRRRP